MNRSQRPENFKNLPIEEKIKIIQDEIKQIEDGTVHNQQTTKRIRNRRLEIQNLLNPDSVVD